MTLLPTRLPDARRAALVLALLLVPVIVLPALAGLVLCPNTDGSATSWSAGSDCPRRGLDGSTTRSLLTSDDTPAVRACLTLPGTDEMITATSSPVPETMSAMLPAAEAVPAPALATRPEVFTERGPPLAVHRALRSVVLRI